MKEILKKTRTEKSTRTVYLIAFILLFLCYLFTLFANSELVKQANRVEHTNNVIKALDNMLGKVVDGETGVRGYIINKNVQFLSPYYGSEEMTDSIYRVLQQLISDNPQQVERLGHLRKTIDQRFGILKFQVATFDQHNRVITDSMLSMQYEGKKVMDDIRSETAQMEREEKRLLTEREKGMKRTTKAITTITIISLTLAFSLLFFGLITYMQVSKGRKKSDQEIIVYQSQLNERISELDKANTELINFRSMEKLAVTGRIARAIAHEIRNPLTNINLAADQIKSEVLKKDESAIYLFEMISRNSNRINQLISDLLSSTKFSELSYEKTSVSDLLDETLEEAADRIALNKIRVIKQYAKDSCTIAVDRDRIKIAFLNIIINAIEAMEEREERILTLETRVENNKCKIIISDTGTGMDSEALTRLFEAYFTSKPKGNGLGLTNSQNIVLNHNGEINVNSSKGKGTSFTILLNYATA